MSSGIFIMRPNAVPLRLEEAKYDSEAVLHELLAQCPDLLPGDQIGVTEPCRWLLIRRETPIEVTGDAGSWFSVDHLFLDQHGVPTLVEVKRAVDVRIRREVVGQMLDYAANAAENWSGDLLRGYYEARCQAGGDDAEEALQDALATPLSYDEFWQAVQANLQTGRMRLLFVADEIPPSLRRVVEFMDQAMSSVEVLAVEVRQYRHGDELALVPRVLGTSTVVQQRKTSPRRGRTDAATFLAACHDPARGVYERLLGFAEAQRLLVSWGSKGFTLGVVCQGQRVCVFAAYPPNASAPAMSGDFAFVYRKVHDPQPIIQPYRAALEAIGFRPSGASVRLNAADLGSQSEPALHGALVDVAARIQEHGLRRDAGDGESVVSPG